MPLKAGTLLLIERGDTHEIRNTGEGPLQTLNVYAPPAYTVEGEEPTGAGGESFWTWQGVRWTMGGGSGSQIPRAGVPLTQQVDLAAFRAGQVFLCPPTLASVTLR